MKRQQEIIKKLKAKSNQIHEICCDPEILLIFPDGDTRMQLDKVDFVLKEQIEMFENFLNVEKSLKRSEGK